jgi:hypothetical protein
MKPFESRYRPDRQRNKIRLRMLPSETAGNQQFEFPSLWQHGFKKGLIIKSLPGDAGPRRRAGASLKRLAFCPECQQNH